MDVLKRLYYLTRHKNVGIYNVTSKDLREFTTTEGDMNKGVSRFPPSNFRVTTEDLFSDASPGLSQSPSTVSTTFADDDNGVFSGS